jgi:hypothetical protein
MLFWATSRARGKMVRIPKREIDKGETAHEQPEPPYYAQPRPMQQHLSKIITAAVAACVSYASSILSP